jgi:hypothetical protein
LCDVADNEPAFNNCAAAGSICTGGTPLSASQTVCAVQIPIICSVAFGTGGRIRTGLAIFFAGGNPGAVKVTAVSNCAGASYCAQTVRKIHAVTPRGAEITSPGSIFVVPTFARRARPIRSAHITPSRARGTPGASCLPQPASFAVSTPGSVTARPVTTLGAGLAELCGRVSPIISLTTTCITLTTGPDTSVTIIRAGLAGVIGRIVSELRRTAARVTPTGGAIGAPFRAPRARIPADVKSLRIVARSAASTGGRRATSGRILDVRSICRIDIVIIDRG